jgi:microcystin-dependent protein
MADPFLGEIQMFAGRIPAGWLPCDGRTLSVSGPYTKLFGLIGTTFGGDGKTTFALPDLQGRVPIGMGQGPGLQSYAQGQKAGEATHPLTIAEIPGHSHVVQAVAARSTTTTNVTHTPGPTTLLAASTAKKSDGTVVTAYMYIDEGQIVSPMDPHTVGDNGPLVGHENRMPYVAVNYCISIQGTSPTA